MRPMIGTGCLRTWPSTAPMVPSPPTAMSLRVERSSRSICSGRRSGSVNSASHDFRSRRKLSNTSPSLCVTSRPTPPPEMGFIKKAKSRMGENSFGVEKPEYAHQQEILEAAGPFPLRPAPARVSRLRLESVSGQAQFTGYIQGARQVVALADDQDAAQPE